MNTDYTDCHNLERTLLSLTLLYRSSTNMDDAFKARQKYSHFRILVIGRANAGKTTLLKRVCNTTEDPRIYDEGKNLVRFLSNSRRGIALTSHGKPAGADPSGDSLV